MVSFTVVGATVSTTSRREITTFESLFGGLKTSARRRKKRLRRFGTVGVSSTTTLPTATVSGRGSVSGVSSSCRIFLSSSPTVPAERMER